MTATEMSAWRQARSAVAGHWQGLALVAVLVSGIIGLMVSPYPDESLPRFGLFLAGLGIYALVTLVVTSERRLWAAFALLPAMALALAALALTATHWITYRFPPIEPLVGAFPRLGPAWMPALAGQVDGLHPSPLAAAMALVLLPMLGVLLFGPRSRTRQRGWLRLVLTGCTLASLPLLALLPLTLARGALLALAVAGLALLAVRRWPAALAAVVAGLALFLLAVAAMPGWLVDRLLYSDLASVEASGSVARVGIWRQAAELSAQAPLTGIGLAVFPLVAQQAAAPAAQPVAHAHNMLLQAALDLGWPGALAYTALVAAAGIGAARSGWRFRRGARAGAAWGLAAAVLALSLHGLIDTITVSSRAGLIVWYVLGLATAVGGAGAWRPEAGEE
jgi:putative inorganic carbon (hco3(-)) transporter